MSSSLPSDRVFQKGAPKLQRDGRRNEKKENRDNILNKKKKEFIDVERTYNMIIMLPIFIGKRKTQNGTYENDINYEQQNNNRRIVKALADSSNSIELLVYIDPVTHVSTSTVDKEIGR
eukprot:34492_1